MIGEENNIKLREFMQNIHTMITSIDEDEEETKLSLIKYCSQKDNFYYIYHSHKNIASSITGEKLSVLPWYKRECYISSQSNDIVDNDFYIHNSPIIFDDKILGVFSIYTRGISDKKRKLYRNAQSLFSSYYSTLFEDITIKETLKRNSSTFSTLDLVTKISQVIIATDSIKDISNKLYSEMKKYFGECAIGIVVNSPKERKLTQCFYYEYDKKLDFNDIPYSRGEESKLLKVVLSKKEETYEYLNSDSKMLVIGHSPSASYFTPLIMNGRVLGAFTYQIFERNSFTEIELDLCRKLIPYMTLTLNHTLQNEALLKTNTKLKYLSSYDSLTELYNRRAFYEIFNKTYKKSLFKNKEVYLILFDLDNFKGVNDNFSHTDGDAAIVRITDLIKKEFSRFQSVLGRYGGDEFLAGVIDISTEDLLRKLHRLRSDVLSLKIPCDKRGAIVGISMGIVKLDIDIPLTEAFHIVDRCMYDAKSHESGIVFSSISNFQMNSSLKKEYHEEEVLSGTFLRDFSEPLHQ